MEFTFAAVEGARRAFEQSDFFAQLFRGQPVCKLQRMHLIHFNEITVAKSFGGGLRIITDAAGVEHETHHHHGEASHGNSFSVGEKKFSSLLTNLPDAARKIFDLYDRLLRHRFGRLHGDQNMVVAFESQAKIRRRRAAWLRVGEFSLDNCGLLFYTRLTFKEKNMALEHRITGEIATVYLTGKLQGGTPDSQEMKDTIQKLLDAGVKKIVLDLADVKRMHSSGLGVLISMLTSVRNRGGDLKLAAINETMEGILAITKLNSIFETFKTVPEAAQSFADS